MKTEIRNTPNRFALFYGPADGHVVEINSKTQPNSLVCTRKISGVTVKDFYDWDASLEKYMWSPNHPFNPGVHAFASPRHPVGLFAC